MKNHQKNLVKILSRTKNREVQRMASELLTSSGVDSHDAKMIQAAVDLPDTELELVKQAHLNVCASRALGMKILFMLVDQKKYNAFQKSLDTPEKKKQLQRISIKLVDEVSPKSPGAKSALQRFINLVSKPSTTPESTGNQMMKIDDELGIK